ncbi:hypothetical protein BRADI_3g06843v3 [Brachypodium distachyon]|uniref:Uncharacterized protein n=1 Tax=Brachypodium distachyon TaxID=15368 RepID=A0A0Q3I094_BRADI|nr:hypothetical protein BRADI_3g06843v3 [Brachypodium distachyon]
MNRKESRRGRRLRHVRLGSLLRLRVRLFRLVGMVARCLEELNWCPGRRSMPLTTRSAGRCRHRPAALPAAHRENSASFHADAIADCLEFIKRSYMKPVQDDHRASTDC